MRNLGWNTGNWYQTEGNQCCKKSKTGGVQYVSVLFPSLPLHLQSMLLRRSTPAQSPAKESGFRRSATVAQQKTTTAIAMCMKIQIQTYATLTRFRRCVWGSSTKKTGSGSLSKTKTERVVATKCHKKSCEITKAIQIHIVRVHWKGCRRITLAPCCLMLVCI